MYASFVFMFLLPLSLFSRAISLFNVFVYVTFIRCYFLPLSFSQGRTSDAGFAAIHLGSSSYHEQK
jgi:ABC-type sulfate transport system permease subunit